MEAADETPFAEDGWVGRVLCIGDLRMRIDKREGRTGFRDIASIDWDDEGVEDKVIDEIRHELNLDGDQR